MIKVAAPAARAKANRKPYIFFMTPSQCLDLSWSLYLDTAFYYRLVEDEVTKITEFLIKGTCSMQVSESMSKRGSSITGPMQCSHAKVALGISQ
jgi:hypothetical protein